MQIYFNLINKQIVKYHAGNEFIEYFTSVTYLHLTPKPSTDDGTDLVPKQLSTFENITIAN